MSETANIAFMQMLVKFTQKYTAFGLVSGVDFGLFPSTFEAEYE
jgi:hypothetical protein